MLTYFAVMDGKARAAEREIEVAISQAWHGEAFARQKRLQPLESYLKSSKGKKPRGGGTLIGRFLEMQAKGVPVKIAKRRRRAGHGNDGQDYRATGA